MTEIKSTLELALERTQKIAISDKEKEEIKHKEVLERAMSLFHQHREGHLPLNNVLKEIEKMEEKTRTMVKEILLSQWIDALFLDDEEERILKGIESLKQQSIDEVKQKFHHLLSQYRKGVEEVKQKMKVQLEEALRREGIDGSAVEPNIEGSEIWKKESEKLNHSYRMKLEEIKEQLRIYR